MATRTRVVYERPLPGGGFVHVEQGEGSPGGEGAQVQVAVERRRDPARRAGHQPPVIASEQDTMLSAALRRVMEIAQDNVEIARRLLRRSGGKARF